MQFLGEVLLFCIFHLSAKVCMQLLSSENWVRAYSWGSCISITLRERSSIIHNCTSTDEHAVSESAYARINPYSYRYLTASAYARVFCMCELLTVLKVEDPIFQCLKVVDKQADKPRQTKHSTPAAHARARGNDWRTIRAWWIVTGTSLFSDPSNWKLTVCTGKTNFVCHCRNWHKSVRKWKFMT